MVVIITQKLKEEWSDSDDHLSSTDSSTENETTEELTDSDETHELYVTVVDTVSAQVLSSPSLTWSPLTPPHLPSSFL
jgi:hypothetical protein